MHGLLKQNAELVNPQRRCMKCSQRPHFQGKLLFGLGLGPPLQYYLDTLFHKVWPSFDWLWKYSSGMMTIWCCRPISPSGIFHEGESTDALRAEFSAWQPKKGYLYIGGDGVSADSAAAALNAADPLKNHLCQQSTGIAPQLRTNT